MFMDSWTRSTLSAHGSMEFIKRWSMAPRSMARIKWIQGVRAHLISNGDQAMDGSHAPMTFGAAWGPTLRWHNSGELRFLSLRCTDFNTISSNGITATQWARFTNLWWRIQSTPSGWWGRGLLLLFDRRAASPRVLQGPKMAFGSSGSSSTSWQSSGNGIAGSLSSLVAWGFQVSGWNFQGNQPLYIGVLVPTRSQCRF
jgi:hypothetical protein